MGSRLDVKAYSHGFEVLVEFPGNLIYKFAASYPDAVFCPTEGRNLLPRSARGSIDRLFVISFYLA